MLFITKNEESNFRLIKESYLMMIVCYLSCKAIFFMSQENYTAMIISVLMMYYCGKKIIKYV